MGSPICITDDGDSSLFMLPPEAICPRVGETISFYFSPSTEDALREFSDEAAKEMASMNGMVWRVVSVDHSVSRTEWNRTLVTTWVRVKRIRKGRSRG